MSPSTAAARAIYRRWLARYFPVATLVLAVSVVVGFYLGSLLPVETFADPSAGGGSTPFVPDTLTTYTIALNNLVAMLVFLLGAVTLGAVTVLGLVLNGLLIGAVVALALTQTDPIVVAALLVPHGIIEIPALLLVSAVGLRFGWLTIRYLRGLEDDLLTERDLVEAGWLVAIAAVLIVVAAYIEANLTLELANQLSERDLTGITG